MVKNVIELLEKKANEKTKVRFINNGATNKVLGVNYTDIKKIAKPYKNDNEMALELYNTHIYECMYMSKYIFDLSNIDEAMIIRFVEESDSYNIIENVLAQLGFYLKNVDTIIERYISSENNNLRLFAYCLYSEYISIVDNSEIDIEKVKETIEIVKNNIKSEENRIKYNMNNFLLVCGAYIPELTSYVIEIAKSIGKVNVDMKNTYCKVAEIPTYLDKMIKLKKIGNKRKTSIC